MALFSERNNLCPKKILQIDSINEDLKVSLWNLFYDLYLAHFTWDLSNITVQERYYFEYIFVEFFKTPLDKVHGYNIKSVYVDKIKVGAFLGKKLDFPWYMTYDFLEFAISNDYDKNRKNCFITAINKCLKKEVAAYRLVKGQVTRITSDIEISEIETAINKSSNEVTIHLEQALIHLSNKVSPDYRNSIKESISAVESYCNTLTKTQKITLGQALDSLEKKTKIQINPALKEGFKKIYGWTCGSDGIRHGLMEESHVGFEEAQFMLVACSAFINYLNEKNQLI